MQCTSKTQAQRMAYFGARKMSEAGYLLRTTQWEGFYDVVKDEETLYSVRIGDPVMPDSCTCPFFTENKEFGICKHLYWTRWQVEAEADAASLAESDPGR